MTCALKYLKRNLNQIIITIRSKTQIKRPKNLRRHSIVFMLQRTCLQETGNPEQGPGALWMDFRSSDQTT